MARRLLVSALILASSCDDPPKLRPAPAPSAAEPDEPAPETPPGCARVGSLDAVERDDTCVLPRVADDVMRDAMSRLALQLDTDVPATVPGATLTLRLSIRNTSKSELLVVLDARAPGAVPHPDWSRLHTGASLKPTSPDVPRLLYPMTTLDAREHDVDALGRAPGSEAPPRILGVRLKPGGTLTHALSWWAMRIPAPMPIYRDDAGHVIVPKTAPTPLSTGEYTVAVAVPLHGLSVQESTVTTRVRVEPAKLKSDASTQ